MGFVTSDDFFFGIHVCIVHIYLLHFLGIFIFGTFKVEFGMSERVYVWVLLDFFADFGLGMERGILNGMVSWLTSLYRFWILDSCLSFGTRCDGARLIF